MLLKDAVSFSLHHLLFRVFFFLADSASQLPAHLTNDSIVRR